MTQKIWSKFFWRDWESDPALRLCSLAAQGLWMRMLCVAAHHDPIGYVAVAGRGLELPDLARMMGSVESEVQILLDELDRNGVFSRDRHHRIYSRRMVRDHRKTLVARMNGKMNGQLRPCKHDENSTSVGGLTGPISQKPDKDSIVPKSNDFETRPIRKKTKTAYSADFEQFWRAYPTDQNMSKFEAFGAWNKLSPEDKTSAFQSISGFVEFCSRDPTYRPVHACRYLAKKRFEGHLEKAKEDSERRKIRIGDPSWDAWRSYFRDTKKNFSVGLMDKSAEEKKPFTVPSEWPPTIQRVSG